MKPFIGLLLALPTITATLNVSIPYIVQNETVSPGGLLTMDNSPSTLDVTDSVDVLCLIGTELDAKTSLVQDRYVTTSLELEFEIDPQNDRKVVVVSITVGDIDVKKHCNNQIATSNGVALGMLCTFDWGDGLTSDLLLSDPETNTTHTYLKKAVYKVSVDCSNGQIILPDQSTSYFQTTKFFSIHFQNVLNPLVFVQTDTIRINADVNLKESVNIQPTLYWRIAKADGGNLSAVLNISQTNSITLILDPEALEPGDYVVVFEVIFPTVGNQWADDYILIRVVLPNLVAIVQGGDYISVPHGGLYYVNGSVSADPVQVTSSVLADELLVTWSCGMVGDIDLARQEAIFVSPFTGTVTADFYLVDNGTELMLEIDTNYFSEDAWLVVMLTLERGTRKTTTAQFINLVSDGLDFTVKCIFNCNIGRDRKFNYDKIELDTVFPDPQLDTRRYTFLWSVSILPTRSFCTVTLAPTVDTPTGYKQPSFKITAGSLQEGCDYEIRVDVTAPGHATSFVSMVRSVGIRPYAGNCTIDPLSGFASTDTFSVVCRNWKGLDYRVVNTTQDANALLLYQASQNVTGAVVHLEPIIETRLPEFDLILKVGDPDNGYINTIVIAVLDINKNSAEISIDVVVNPAINVTEVTADDAGAIQVTDFAQIYEARQNRLYLVADIELLLPLAVSVCTHFHLIDLPVPTPPVPRKLNNDGFIMDLNPAGNKDIGDVENALGNAINDTMDPATIAIQDFLEDMSTFVQNLTIDYIVASESRKYDQLTKSLLTNVLSNIAGKKQYVNTGTKLAVITLGEVVGVSSLEDIMTGVAAGDMAGAIENAADEVSDMYHTLGSSTVPDNLRNNRPVVNLLSGRKQVEAMLQASGETFDLESSEFTEDERAFLYMRMQLDLKYKTARKKPQARKAVGMAGKLMKSVQENLRMCDRCDNTDNARTKQRVAKNSVESLTSRNFSMPTSNFQLGGLGQLRDNVPVTDNTKASVSATEFTDNIYMYDDDGKSGFISSNVLHIDVKAEETYVTPGYVTFEMTVVTPAPQLTSPFVDPEDASELSLHRFLYQSSTDYVCFIIQPGSIVDVVIAQYVVYIRYIEAPTILDYDVMVSVTPSTDWRTCVHPDLMRGHTGLAFLGIHVPGIVKQVNYTFTLITVACMVWDETQTTWLTDKCDLEWLPDQDKIRCFCSDVTELTFANSFYVAPNTIDFSSVFLKFSAKEQAAVIGTLAGIFVIFILAIIFLRGKDRLDVYKWGVTPLVDNRFESDHFYLIQVYTGMRRGAGTTSNVGINLTGDFRDSGIRHLYDGIRKKFSTGSVMTFLMATTTSLGTLEHLYIWHDNTGQGDLASWYLDHVTVYDIRTRKTSTFIAERWLSVETGCDAKLSAVSQDSKLQFESRFFGQARRQLSDNHMWMSILYRPQSSSFTRVQRASCALCFILLSMIANAMYFNPDPEYVSPPLFQIGPFRFTKEQVFTSLICALITTPAVMLLVFLFKHTRQAPSSGGGSRWNRLSQRHDSNGCCCCRKVKANKTFSSDHGSTCSLGQTPHEQPIKDEAKMLEECTLSTGVPETIAGVSLHYRFIYVAWLVVAVSVLVSSFFILLYSMEWGKQKSEEWLSAICMSILESMMLIDPVLVICMSLLLACIIRKNTTSLNFDVDEIVKNYKSKIGRDKDGLDMCYVLLKRLIQENDPSVALGPPPEGQELTEATERSKLQHSMSNMCWNLLINLIFMFTVFGICYYNRDAHAYDYQNHVIQQLAQPLVKRPTGPKFLKIITHDDFFAWLNTTVLPKLFPEHDVAGVPLHWSSRIYTEGLVNLRLGPPRIRQLRVYPDTCKLPYFGTVGCYDKYTIQDEFTKELCIGWTHTPCSQIMATYNMSLPAWSFTSAFDIWGLPITGEYSTYGGGGYIANFDVSRNISVTIINELFYQRWLDRQTRAVILEFTLYNAGTQLFVYCEFMVEFPETGGALPSYKLYPLRPHHLTGPRGNFLIFLEVLFGVFVIVLIVKLSIKFYQYRCRMFSNFWVSYDVVILVFCILAIILFVFRNVFAQKTIEAFREDQKLFVNFAHIVLWDGLFMTAASILAFMTTLRVIEVFASSKKISSVVRVLSHCRGDLLQFGIFFAYVLFAFCILGYLLFGDDLELYKNLYRSLTTLFLSLLGKNRFNEMEEGFPVLAKFFFILYTICTFFFVMTIFMSVLGSSVDTVVHDMRYDTSDDILDYIGKQIKLLVFKPTGKQTERSTDTKSPIYTGDNVRSAFKR